MNCKNFKIKQKNYKRIFYCNAQRKEIDYHKCSKECEYYEDKMHSHCAKASLKIKECTKKQKYCAKIKKMANCRSSKQLRQKSKELAKLEKNRFSILGSTKNKCFLCPASTDLTWHEVFRGKNRANSMKYGLCLRLCHNCHERWQEDKEFNNYWHKVGQNAFKQAYPHLDFMEIFKRNYL